MAGDARLLRASLRGDQDAFARIVRRYQSLVCAITYSGTGDVAASEDLAQETFLTAWQRLASLRDPSALRAWLCTIARNLTTDHLRRRQRDVAADAAPVQEAEGVESAPPTPAEQAEAKERQRVVWAALQDIPETYRVPLVLYYRESRSTRLVARDLELSQAAVGQRLARGREMLRDKVAGLVEDTLSTTAPGGAFSAAVLAGMGLSAAKKGAGVGSTVFGLSLAKATAVGALAAGVGLGAWLALQPEAQKAPAPPPAAPLAAPAPEPAEDGTEVHPRGVVIHGVVVDEAGRPVPGVLVNTPVTWAAAPEDVATAEDGSFTLELPCPTSNALPILASAQGGEFQGIYRFGPDPLGVPPIRIVLRPARRVEVTVTDGRGAPVPGAAVEAYHYYALLAVVTDETGWAELLVPADEQIRWVLAAKPGVGFDYFENYTSWPPPRETGVPDSAHLVLDGATTVRITAVDSGWDPIQGVEFAPVVIMKEGKVTGANVPGSRTLAARGDADGVASFDWIPSTGIRFVEFGIGDGSFSRRDSIRYTPTSLTGELTAILLRNTPISGKVFLPDGSPAVGMLVQAESGGNTNYCRAYARTGQDGSYVIQAYTEQTYMIGVLDDEWAAPSKMGVFVREGRPMEHVDFRLEPGTLIHGTARMEKDGRPAAGRTVVLVQRDPGLPEEFLGDHGKQETHLVRWTEIDDAGRYRFRAARGVFTIGVQPDGDELLLVIEDQAEIVQDFLLKEPEPQPAIGASPAPAEIPELAQAARDGNRQEVERLLAEGADVTVMDNAGRTPLHHAAESGHRAVVEALLAAGADVNATDLQGCTPAGLAVQNGHDAVADLLRQHGGVE